MPASPKPKHRPARRARRAAPPQPSPKPYHHGDLRRALVDAALHLAAEGAEVSVREAARRAGVSPGAPFRHFPSRDALMTAVAAEAQRRFRSEIEVALAAAPSGDPLAQIRSLGLGYLRWAMKNPAYFEIISTVKYFDHDASGALSKDNAEIIAMMARLLGEAAARGKLRHGDLKRTQIAARALVYGFARMLIDGHFPRWGVAEDEVEPMAEGIVDLFIDGIANR
jgi:AcrR family transcriptional regulator